MLRYLSLDIICSSKLTVFLELRSWKTVRFSEQITSADKYLSIFSRQMEAIVYILGWRDLTNGFMTGIRDNYLDELWLFIFLPVKLKFANYKITTVTTTTKISVTNPFLCRLLLFFAKQTLLLKTGSLYILIPRI